METGKRISFFSVLVFVVWPNLLSANNIGKLYYMYMYCYSMENLCAHKQYYNYGMHMITNEPSSEKTFKFCYS